jgi:hypothetical protein
MLVLLIGGEYESRKRTGSILSWLPNRGELIKEKARTISNKVVYQQDSNEENSDLETIETHIHTVVVQNPADDDQQGDHEECNLHTGTDCNANSQIHLVFASDGYGSGVLCGISNNREQDQTNKFNGDSTFGDRANTIDHKLCSGLEIGAVFFLAYIPEQSPIIAVAPARVAHETMM